MAFTKAHAKILAGMLSDEALKVLRIYRDRKSDSVGEAGVNEVVSFMLIRETTNLLDGKKVWVLTPDGKKVAEFCGKGAE